MMNHEMVRVVII